MSSLGPRPTARGRRPPSPRYMSDELGVPVDDIEIVHGDTDNTPMGWGTYGSRTTVVGGARGGPEPPGRSRTKPITLAAHLLEAAEADIQYEDGKFFVRGVSGAAPRPSRKSP